MKQSLMFLAFAMIAWFTPNAHAQSFSVDNLNYSVLSGNTVTIIGHGTVSGSLVIPTSVTYDGETYTVVRIGNNAFQNCSDLTSLTIPNTVNYIGSGAFANCSGLISVVFNADSCTYAGYSSYDYYYDDYYYNNSGVAFYNCTNITNFSFGDNVKVIPGNLCNGLIGLTSISFPASLTRIGDYAFRGCGLTTLTVPSQVVSIGGEAFHCPNLSTVYFNTKNTNSQFIFGGITISRFFLGDSVSSLKEQAFRCTVDTLFYNPVSLHFGQYEIIDRSYNTIFTNVRNIVIGPNVDSIPQKLLLGDTALTSLTIPENVRYVGPGAFACSEMTTSGLIGHSNLRTLHYNARKLSNASMFRYISQFSYASYIQNATIGNQVEYIAEDLFGGDTALTTITLPISVKEIGWGAFSGTNLSSITLPDSLAKIDGGAFSGTPLTEIVFPASVRYIGEEAFDGTGITSVTIPATIDTILEYAFSGCPLSVVNYNATNAYCNGAVFTPSYHWDENDNLVYDVETQTLNIGSNVRSIPNSIFSNMRISSVVLPDSLQSIGEQSFYNTQLTSIVIPDMVTTIGASAFRPYQTPYYYGGDNNATNTLHRVTIGASVNSIGDYAFAGITTPDTIFMRAEVPPIIAAHTFDQMPTNSKIIVPCGTKEDYEDAPYWNNFTRIQEHPSCFMLITVNSSNPAYGTVSGGGRYSIGNIATLSAMPFNGNAFTGWTDGNSDNPRLVLVTGNASYTANFATATLTPVHDTTYIDVHDTTYIDVFVHDTTVVTQIDTVILTEYVPVHDTTTVFDTTYIDVPYAVHDTTYIDVHDTTYIDVPYAVHDTTYITLTDTVTTTVYDTTIVDNYIYDTTFVFDTTVVTDTLWLTQYDTIVIYDTVYIHDTVVVGVGDVEGVNAKVYSSRGQIVVEGAEGNPVTLYDVTGRMLATKQDNFTPLRFDAPASGTYLIKIGSYAARRVVVVR